MFRAEDIQARLREKPFRPLRIIARVGTNTLQFENRHPDLVLVGRQDMMIGFPGPGNPSVYDRVTRLALVHVVALEDLPNLADPGNGRGDWIEKKFIRLRDEWRAKRGHHSDTASLVMHPAYQEIIGMGPDALPFLLRELAIRPDRWFWALRAITGEDPVPGEARGNSAAMTQAWLKWGEERGFQF